MDKNLPSLCLIGHTDYSMKIRKAELHAPFGEINNARKLQEELKKIRGCDVTEILDILELFEIKDSDSERAILATNMINTNRALDSAGQEIITNFDNKLARSFHQNIRAALEPSKDYVLVFLTWSTNALLSLSVGIHHKFPTILREYSHIRGYFPEQMRPIGRFASEADLVTGQSLLGAINSREYDLPPGKFLYLPNITPPETESLIHKDPKKVKEFRLNYVNHLAEKNKKTIRLNENTVIIGCPCRFLRRKNVDALIHVINELYHEDPNILLILKGTFDTEEDHFTQYSEKLNQLIQGAKGKPWLLWDQAHTPYPEILQIFSSFDVCALPTGAEAGNNTIIEVCALGLPCVILDASDNPYLFRDMALFAATRKLILAKWIYSQPLLENLKEKLRQLIRSPEERKILGERAHKLAKQRFGSHQLLERIPLMTRAAWSSFHKDSDADFFRQQLIEKLQQDLKEYGLQEQLA